MHEVHVEIRIRNKDKNVHGDYMSFPDIRVPIGFRDGGYPIPDSEDVSTRIAAQVKKAVDSYADYRATNP